MRARGDLLRINYIMGHPWLMAGVLRRFEAPRVLCDIGGGDGRFVLKLARLLSRGWSKVHVIIADRHDIVSSKTRLGFAKLGWTCEILTGDVFSLLPAIRAEIVIANLFLHHFDEAMLADLLTLMPAKLFVACEPRRSRLALAAGKLVFLLGCNAVTRHDAVTSVRAGFRDLELSRLWPKGRWQLCEYWAFPFSHVFIAHGL